MKNDIFLKLWSYISGIIVIGIIVFIFLYILIKGFNVMSFEFLTSSPKGMPLGTEGGIFPAIMGTIYLGLICAGIGGIFSVCTAVYLAFYSRNKALYELIMFCIRSVSGIPSIILGLFGYSFFIMKFEIPKGLLSAGFTLSIMVIPFITIRIEKQFREFSKGVFDSSLALGVSKIYTIRKIVIRKSFGKILSAIMLGTTYAVGAAAPIMFTGVAIFAKSPRSINDTFMALSYHLYMIISEGLSIEMAYGTAFVLMMLVLIVNLLCRFLWKEDSFGKDNRG